MKTFVSFVVLLAACQSSESVPSGPGLAINVAPLTLPGIADASYAITVKSRLGATVWTKAGLTSVTYGNGQGALSYVGPCDASENPHSVELVLESVTGTSGPLTSPADYVNPTISVNGDATPIIKTNVVCAANGDVAVDFNLTIMRSARQGFFDFAVEFNDVFCSAKIDCKDSLMLRPDGSRGPTAVFGFACTAGSGSPTYLYLSDLSLTCTGGSGVTQTFDLGQAVAGQQGAKTPGVFQWSVFRDEELVEQTDFEKCFWNTSIGLDTEALAGQSCHLTATGTASGEPLVANGNAYTLPGGGAYPVVKWDVEVVKPSGALCTNNGLDGSGGVTTGYATNAASLVGLAPLTAQYRCGQGVEEPEPQPIACNGTSQGAITASPTETGFTLSIGDGSLTPASFALPPGYRLGSSCCTPGCCQ